MINVDFKVSVWERVQLPDKHLSEALDLLKSNKLNTSNELYEHFIDEAEYKGYIDETEEAFVSSDGSSTITLDLSTEDGTTTLWNNRVEEYLWACSVVLKKEKSTLTHELLNTVLTTKAKSRDLAKALVRVQYDKRIKDKEDKLYGMTIFSIACTKV